MYQPQVGPDGTVKGAEALLRWSHPLRGKVMPDRFIPLAEETGLIIPIGKWIFATACAQLVEWAGHPDTQDLELAVNVSVQQFQDPDFVDIVIHSYRHRYGAAPSDPALESVEQQLTGQPVIEVPTIVLHGEGDGVHPPERSAGQENRFSRYYERQLIPKAGHLFPREAPDAVIAAVQKMSRIR